MNDPSCRLLVTARDGVWRTVVVKGSYAGVGEVMRRRRHMSKSPLGRKEKKSRCGLRPLSDDGGGTILDLDRIDS
jgi:hypothetical protein